MSAFSPGQRTEVRRLLTQLANLVQAAGTTRQARTAAITEVGRELERQVMEQRIANAGGRPQPSHRPAGEYRGTDPTPADLARLRGQRHRMVQTGPGQYASSSGMEFRRDPDTGRWETVQPRGAGTPPRTGQMQRRDRQ